MEGLDHRDSSRELSEKLCQEYPAVEEQLRCTRMQEKNIAPVCCSKAGDDSEMILFSFAFQPSSFLA